MRLNQPVKGPGPAAPAVAADSAEPAARPTACAVPDGPLWGLVRLTVPAAGGLVQRNLDAADARRLATSLLTAADEADGMRARSRP